MKGLITIKDIEKVRKYPHACKDEIGRLRVGAAIGVGPDREARLEALVKAGVDVVAIDTAHGHSQGVIDAVVATKRAYPDLQLIAGNIATAAELIVRCALERRESRGLHYNIDFPQSDDLRWKRDTVIRKTV